MGLLLALLFLLQLTDAYGQDDDSEEREVAAFNASVSDADIADWLAFEVQYDPVDRAEWSALTPEARALKIGEIRGEHEKHHVRLSTLRGLSAKEFDSLRQTMQFRAVLMQSLRAARALMPILRTDQHALIRDTCVLEMSASTQLRAGYRNLTAWERAWASGCTERTASGGCSGSTSTNPGMSTRSHYHDRRGPVAAIGSRH